jgi:hypothetical protein
MEGCFHRKVKMGVLLDLATGGTAILSFTTVFGRFASTFAFAGIFALTSVIPGFASTLSLARILAFTSMFPFVLICQHVRGGGGCSGNTSGVRRNSEGSG